MFRVLYLLFAVSLIFSCKKIETADTQPKIVEVDAGGNYVHGNDSAPVKLIAFSDFECPYCYSFFELVEGIEAKYIVTGKVQYVHRDFPLESHDNARSSSACANCAGEQGKYWEMYRILFKNQADLNDEYYFKWATQLDLDIIKFQLCLEAPSTFVEIENDYLKGQAIGVDGTPSFIINNEMFTGVPPEDVFWKLLDEAILKAEQ